MADRASGFTVPLESVTADEVRRHVDPIQQRLSKALQGVAEKDSELIVVFSFDDAGHLSVKLRADAFVVNTARDVLGQQFAVSRNIN